MNSHTDRCDLCGLSLQYGTVHATFAKKSFRFCCMGCKQVFAMLLEASDSADPADFKNTELFQRCRAMGIIPQTEADLADNVSRHSSASPTAEEGPLEDLLPLSLTITGMWCPACAWVIEEWVHKKAGISTVSCIFSTDRFRCTYNPVLISPKDIVETIEQLGYKGDVPGSDIVVQERKREIVRLIVSAFFTMNVMMLSFALYSGFFTNLSRDAVWKLSLPIGVLASIVLGYGGRTIFKRAWAGLTSAAHSMETLIALGSLSAYLFSVYNLFHGSLHLYFDTASMLITLVLVGKFFESRAKDRIQQDLQSLMSLLPTKVRLCTVDSPQGRYVSAEQLQKEDYFCIGENEIVPADAVIIEGAGKVDESSITGEAQPIRIKPGDRLKSGTKIMQGVFRAKAIAVGGSSILGQMVEVIEKALENKTSLEGKTDRILQWFVPVIVLLAVGTAAWCYLFGLAAEQSLIRAITVIVISCPCALGIAIPLVRVAGISAAGKCGIVVRDFSSFEQAEKIDAFVFDKTGTITTGRWSLRNIKTLGTYSKETVLTVAAGLEIDFDHTIARGIKQQAQALNLEPAAITAIIQHNNGIAGVYNGDSVRIGSRVFAGNKEDNHDEPQDGSSRVYLSISGTVCAFFEFGDTIRDGAVSSLKELASRGYERSVVSGDGASATNYVAHNVGIDDAHGGLLPHEKAAFIAVLQDNGHRVAMVGDGVNDAAALVQADLAIAVHGETPLAKEVADITLMRGNPEQILDFLSLAGRVNSKVFQNLFFSFLYNAVSIPIAMSGVLNPLVAVCAMVMSSLTVTGNALLLVRKGK